MFCDFSVSFHYNFCFFPMHVSKWHLGLTLGNLVFFLGSKEDIKTQLLGDNFY